MNQLFRKHYYEPRVNSLQIEIIYELRKDYEIATLTGEYIGMSISDMLSRGTWGRDPNDITKQY